MQKIFIVGDEEVHKGVAEKLLDIGFEAEFIEAEDFIADSPKRNVLIVGGGPIGRLHAPNPAEVLVNNILQDAEKKVRDMKRVIIEKTPVMGYEFFQTERVGKGGRAQKRSNFQRNHFNKKR